MPKDATTHDLPADNASRLAIYDVLAEHASTESESGLTDTALFERVIGRLRMLVPRELYIAGERTYLNEKIDACIEAGIITADSRGTERVLRLTGIAPQIRYPDGELRHYPAGLELARERLEQDNASLRKAEFDIRNFIPSIAHDINGAAFQSLLSSMREHGFMKNFAIVRYDDGFVADGLARIKAAEMLNISPVFFKHAPGKDSRAARIRDTPLTRILVAVHTNSGRLSAEVMDSIFARVASITGREWKQTQKDLDLTAEWRSSVPPEYKTLFETTKLPARGGEEPKIQVTPDRKVMLRSLIEAFGLASYKVSVLEDYVTLERARSRHSPGQKALFARAEDLIKGIPVMQEQRKAAKLKVDSEWEQIHQWLVRNF